MKITTAKKLLQQYRNLYQGLIFDLDGTLVDSMGVWRQIDMEFLKKRGVDMDEEYYSTVKTMTLQDCADYTIRRFHLNETPQHIISEWRAMALSSYENEIEVKDGVIQFLKALQQMGVPMVLASVSPSDFVNASLNHCRLRPYFSDIIDIDEVGRGKESPDIYLASAGSMGLSAGQCMVFEDALQGLTTAHRAGFLTTAVYDSNSPQLTKEVLSDCADYYLKDFRL